MFFLASIIISTLFDCSTPKLKEAPIEDAIHVWHVPEFDDTVWTFGREQTWDFGFYRQEYGELICTKCNRPIYSCCDSNEVWPMKEVWRPDWIGGNWQKTYCQDARWLGQVKEKEFQRFLKRKALDYILKD